MLSLRLARNSFPEEKLTTSTSGLRDKLCTSNLLYHSLSSTTTILKGLLIIYTNHFQNTKIHFCTGTENFIIVISPIPPQEVGLSCQSPRLFLPPTNQCITYYVRSLLYPLSFSTTDIRPQLQYACKVPIFYGPGKPRIPMNYFSPLFLFQPIL